MVLTIIDIIFVFLMSFLILKFSRTKAVSFLGTVGSAYVIGILYSIIVFALRKAGIFESRDTTALELLGYLGIAVGIPLLLFSSNIKYVFKLSGRVFLAYMLLIVSAVIVSIVWFLLYTRKITDGDILTGMAVGLYSGGTVNLNAVAGFFRLDQQTIFMANLSDMIFGGIFYVFLLFLAKPFTGLFLKKGQKEEILPDIELSAEDEVGKFNIKSPGVIRNFFISILIVVISAGVGFVIFLLKGQKEGTLIDCLLPAILIGTAILGLAVSFIPKVNSVKENGTMGQFFVTVFCCAVASMFDFTNFGVVTMKLFILYSGISVSIFLIHLLLCRLFKIDSETMIVTSTAGIYGPAFIPGVTRAINAEYLLAGGLITGSLGYALGTFLGILVVWICRIF